jgi:preprotein translocase subunit SecF
MLDIIGKKNIYFLISLILIIPGVISLILYGLNLSIDFTGGTRMELAFQKIVDQSTVQKIREDFTQEKIKIETLQTSGKSVFIRTTQINEKKNATLLKKLQTNLGPFKEESFETIGPTIGGETTKNAFLSVLLSSALILLYIAISFRKVPKPTSSLRFGVATIVALLHDVLVLLGIFSLLGHFFHVEVDSLFITALLTVIGFSVHDTIVVFDRIRENLQRVGGHSFAQIVNDSILQTFVRSLNTSLTAILVLFTLMLFGGESIRWFVVALLVGIASGTYSSIFNAAPLLVLWDDFDKRRKHRQLKK